MNRIVVITGASSGIGLELKKLYLEASDTVVTISRSEDKGNDNHYACDVSNEEQVKQLEIYLEDYSILTEFDGCRWFITNG